MKICSFLMLMLLAAPRSEAADDVATQAKRLFVTGRQHFDLGEYTDALKDFKEGYRLNDDPVYLYNIAQCERLLGHDNEALRAYQVYLQRSPDAPNRDEVERKIAALREAVAAHKEAGSKPPNQVLSPDAQANAPSSPELTAEKKRTSEHKPVYKKWWLWTTIGIVAVAGAGVGLGIGLSRTGSSGTTYTAVQF
jgi:tetratricopeptide (TPR) repeat protein